MDKGRLIGGSRKRRATRGVRMGAVAVVLFGCFAGMMADTVGVHISFPQGEIIENKTDTTASKRFALTDTLRMGVLEEKAKNVNFEMKVWAENLHGLPGKKYIFRDAEGKAKRVSCPEWGLAIGDSLRLMMSKRSEEDALGGVNRSVHINILYNDTQIAEGQLDMSGKEWYATVLHILTRKGSQWTFSIVGDDPAEGDENDFVEGKENGKGRRISFRIPEEDVRESGEDVRESVREVGVVVAPGGSVRLAALSAVENLPLSVETVDVDLLKTQCAEAFSPLAGEWEVYDFNIDTDLLKLEPLRLIIVPDGPDTLGIYYLSGYNEHSEWEPGMRKGTLHKTSFADTYDTEWLDAEFRPMARGIKASYSGDALLKIHFPAQDSWIRLRRHDWD